MDRRRFGGSSVGVLAVALALLAALGAWNYQRNLRAEREELRPYRSYDEVALGQLAEAYRGELESLRQRLEEARSSRGAAGQGGGALLGERVAGFEQVQRRARRERELAGAVAEREAALRALDAERARRAAERDRVRLHLRRLLHFEP